MSKVYHLKRNRKKNTALLVALSVIVLAAISIMTATLVTNGGKLSISGIANLFSANKSKGNAEEFYFDSGENAAFGTVGNGFVAATETGIQVFNGNGKEITVETLSMTDPTVCSAGETAVVYDIGGTSVHIVNENGEKKSLKAGGNIISASLNPNGCLALCEEESGYKGSVTVYNENGDAIYKWYSGDGYVLSAALSSDAKSMAVLTLTDSGSRVAYFGLNSTNEKYACQFGGEIVLSIRYLDDGSLIALAKDALYAVDTSGKSKKIADYSDKYIGGYSLDGDGFTALYLKNYQVGNQGGLMTVDKKGNVLGKIDTDREVLSISASGKYVAVLWSDGMTIYGTDLKKLADFSETAGAVKALMRPDGSAVAVLAHSASVYHIKK